jgi:hypothetical protein
VRFLSVESTGTNVGLTIAIWNKDVPDGSLRYTHVTASAEGGRNINIGVANINSSPVMHNFTASASGGNGNYGVANINSSPAMNNVTASASGGGNNDGVFNNSSSPAMHNVTASASGSTYDNFGVHNIELSVPAIRNSSITGSTNSIRNGFDSTAKVANTMLDGTASGTGFTCIGVYNTSFAALNANCQ